jgi:hypothetical protein
VQNWSKGTKIALLISLSLHFIMFVVMRGTSVYGSINISKWTSIDIINIPPQSSVLPQMFNKKIDMAERKWTPVKRSTKINHEVSSAKLSTGELPRRQIAAKTENVSRLNVPSVDSKVSSDSFLTNTMPFSSSTGSDLLSQSSELGKNASSDRLARSRNMPDSVKIIPAPQRNISVTNQAVSEKLQIYKDAEMPFVEGLKAFGNHIVSTKTSKRIDVTFVLDISESMQDDIDSIRRHIYRMIESFNEENLDFTLGVVIFHYNMLFDWLGTDIEITSQTHDVEEIRSVLKGIKVSGEERQLDALMKAFSKVKFRSGVSKHFIFVTDEYVKGTYTISDVLKEAKRSKIVVDVLGRDEPFQRSIAEQTGGLWMPIEATDMN